MRTFVSAKLHDLRVTDASIDYIGSVTIDAALLDACGIEPYEQIDVVNLNNGARWTTYALPGETGVFTLNGGGARLGVVGDRCVVMAYQTADHFEGATAIFVDETNALLRVIEYPLPSPVVQ